MRASSRSKRALGPGHAGVRILLAIAVLGLAIAGCQRAPNAGTGVVGAGRHRRLTHRTPEVEGDDLMRQHRYDEAAVKYQAALNEATTPSSN